MKNYFFLMAVLFLACKEKPKSVDSETHTNTLPNSASTSEIVYKAPSAWIAEAVNSPMRKAQFRIIGKAGDAEMAVFFFPTAGGSVEANLDRWFGQFKQTDGSTSKDKARRETQSINGLSVTTVYLTGTYMKPRVAGMMGGPVDDTPGYALHAAIVETDDGPWFFKSVGPLATVDDNKKLFQELVSTFQLKK